jgi:hypothetical protein
MVVIVTPVLFAIRVMVLVRTGVSVFRGGLLCLWIGVMIR